MNSKMHNLLLKLTGYSLKLDLYFKISPGPSAGPELHLTLKTPPLAQPQEHLAQCCSRDLLVRGWYLTKRDRDKTETLGVRDQDRVSETETLDIRDRDRDRDLQCTTCVKTFKGVGEMKLHFNTWFYQEWTLLAYTGYQTCTLVWTWNGPEEERSMSFSWTSMCPPRTDLDKQRKKNYSRNCKELCHWMLGRLGQCYPLARFWIATNCFCKMLPLNNAPGSYGPGPLHIVWTK